ncbi:MAG: hypothetical protein U0235_30670, partial [Polyangiaceae bacterium]
WVLYGQKDTACPTLEAVATCAFPTRLTLALGERGGTFGQEWRVDATRTVPLPGAERRWPLDVKVDGKRAVVVLQGGRPSVEVNAGTHRIEGSFAWDSLPESLAVPPETGLLTLSVRGKPVASPMRDAQGVVWLQKTEAAAEGDALEVVVHRRIEDDVPMRLVTRIQLVVAGKNREIVLGRSLPAGFVPMRLDAQLPTKVEPDSRLRVQARAGTWIIELKARSEGAVTALERPQPDGPWREGDEVWVFQARPELRVVEATGVAAIDPQQTSLPDDWKKLPAYPMKLGSKLAFVEKRRGDADPPPDQLTLSRRMWLDFDGAGMTMSDRLTGTLSRSTRLEMQKPAALGRVAIRGKDQFITQLGDASRVGVEIRQGDLDVVADSRVTGDTSEVPAVGWNHNFAHVSGTLFVPPGYRVLHASGVDEVPGTWVRHWRLLEIFLVLILALATARLFGIGWGHRARDPRPHAAGERLHQVDLGNPSWASRPSCASSRPGKVRLTFSVPVRGGDDGARAPPDPFLVDHAAKASTRRSLGRRGGARGRRRCRDHDEGGAGRAHAGSAVQVAPRGQNRCIDAPSEAPANAEQVQDKPARDDLKRKPEPKASSVGRSATGLRRRRVNSSSTSTSTIRTRWCRPVPGSQRLNVDGVADLRWATPVEHGRTLHLFVVGPRGNAPRSSSPRRSSSRSSRAACAA